ncbi:MAG: hypothetical protein ABIF01_01705 [Candidatus Micrarchaeota archaeon]
MARTYRKPENGSSMGSTSAKKIVDCMPGQEFVFTTPDGRAVGKAKNIVEFIRVVKNAPIESVMFHVKGNHFAPWLELIGEKSAAGKISKLNGNGQDVRLQIIRSV